MSRKYERTLAGRPLTVEIGKVAEQADGAVIIQYGETVVLVTACMSDQPREGIDFFPLTVDYEERLYAAGKIPGSFFRREGRPTTEAVIAARLTDRALRPLFPKGMRNDVQIVVTVLSAGSAAVAPYTDSGARFPLETSQFEVIDQRPFEHILREWHGPAGIENFEPVPPA